MNYQEALSLETQAQDEVEKMTAAIQAHRDRPVEWFNLNESKITKVDMSTLPALKETGEMAFVIVKEDFFVPVPTKVIKVNVKSFRLEELEGTQTFTVYVDDEGSLVAVEADPYPSNKKVALYTSSVLEEVKKKNEYLQKNKELKAARDKALSAAKAARVRTQVEWTRENLPFVFDAECVGASEITQIFTLTTKTRGGHFAAAVIAVKETESYTNESDEVGSRWSAQVSSVTTGRFGGGSGFYTDEWNLTLHEFMALIIHDIYED